MRASKQLLLLVVVIIVFAALPAIPARAQPGVVDIEIGRSGQNRPISAVRIGNGPRKLVLVGATHGYPERNTYQLAELLAEYFRTHPDDVPAGVRLYIVPLLNPDGLALETRFNAAGIDLNRNMNTNFDACDDNDWDITVQGARGIVSDTGGRYPDSEPETRVIRDFLLDASAVVFFHSDGGDVFPAACEHAPSIKLAQVYAQQSGYRYDRYWQNYLITGGMHDWAASIGIAAIIPELFTGVDPDYAANLGAVQAILSRADELLPAPEDQQVDGMLVPALIWRYWRAHGGEAMFGRPIAAAERFGAITRQVFTNAVIEVHPDQADTPYLVQMAPLGRRMADPASQPAQASGSGYFFPETGHNVNGSYARFWDEAGGVAFLGFPLSEAQQRGGQLTQYFERAIVTYDISTAAARLEPLGWYTLVADRASAPTQANQIR